MSKRIEPIHPGEILKDEFLKPLKISQYRLAKDINVAPLRISEIVRSKRAISADTALRLSKYFNMSPQFWLNLQAHHDLEVEAEEMKRVLEYEIKPFNMEAFKMCDAARK